MKRTAIPRIPFELPQEFAGLTEGASVYDSSCSPDAKVYLIDRGDGFYLKRGRPGSLRREAALTRYFHSLGLGASVLYYGTDEDADWLLSTRVAGEDCTHAVYLAEPKRLADTIGERLRALHEISPVGCPVTDHTERYIATVEKNYRSGVYDASLFSDGFGCRSAEEAYRIFSEGKSALRSEVLLHGDYCLPNIMLDGWHLSGFIDLGNGGVGDRHVDLFWGAWSLGFNLGTDAYRDRFFDAYGRDRIDAARLSAVSVAEAFG